MNFKTYLAKTERVYTYRIKSVSDLGPNVKEITTFLKRYNILDNKTPKRTIIQKNPVDFPSVQNREVFMLDVTLGMPVSSHILERDLVGLLGLPGDYLVVRGENDPLELQVTNFDQDKSIKDQAEKDGLDAQPLLGGDYQEAEHTVDGSNYYGDSYNSRLLKHLSDISTEREESNKVKVPGLFSWMASDATKSEDFNKDHKAPEVKADQNARKTSQHGNFLDGQDVKKKTFLKKDLKSKTIQSKK